MMRRRIFCLIVALALITGIGVSSGQSAETETDAIYTLGEVVVSAERQGVEAISTTREITASEIKTRGARTLDEAISLLPGVVIRTGAQGVPRVDLRGFRSRHVILLLNGIPMNSTNDGQFDPSLIATGNIAKIKISYGNSSVLYGDGGLAGVINIITKKGKGRPHGSLAGELGAGEYYLGCLSVAGGGDSMDFYAGGSTMRRNGFQLSDGFDVTAEEDGDLRENSDKKRSNLFANLGFQPSQIVSMGLTFNYHDSEYGIPPSTVDRNDDPFASKIRYDRVDDLEGTSGQFSVSIDPAGPFDVRAWVFANRQYEENNRYDDPTYTSFLNANAFHHEDTMSVYGGSVQTGYDVGNSGHINLGLNNRTEGLDSSGYDIGRRDTTYIDQENNLKINSAALEYNGHLIDDLGFTIGYGHHWLDKEDGDDDDDSSYLLGLFYDLNQNVRVTGSYAKKIRFPTIRQLYGEGEGNEDLTTEHSDNYEAGIEWFLPFDSTISLTGFHMEVKDYIEKIDDIFINNEHYIFTGFELSAETRPLSALMFRLGYSYLEGKDESEGSNRDELQYRPEHKVSLEVQYDFDFGLTAYGSLMHIADQYTYSADEPPEKTALNDITVVNVKFSQTLLNRRVTLYVGADNLLDADYEESYALPQSGRYIYAGVELRY
jgi:vitamin B12 transporter